MLELNLYESLAIVELIVLLLIAIALMYRRIRKYRPYYEANTSPEDYIRKYFTRALEFSRGYAKSLVADAESGNKTAIKRRQNMVARLNWLVLERDFITNSKPNTSYWDDICFRITKMLKRWTEIDFIEKPPEGDAITNALNGTDTVADLDIDKYGEYDPSSGDISLAGPQNNDKARIQYLEKQVLKLGSYKTLYFGLQNTYDSVQKSYKELKRKISELKLESGEAELLKKALAEHESVEKGMEEQMDKMEAMRERMNAELGQLEAAYAKLEEDYFEQQKREEESQSIQINAGQGKVDGNLIEHQEILDQQEILLREFRGFLHTLNLDTDTKLEIDDKTGEIERNAGEIKTCISMLEMERERLKKELDAVTGIDDDQDAA